MGNKRDYVSFYESWPVIEIAVPFQSHMTMLIIIKGGPPPPPYVLLFSLLPPFNASFRHTTNERVHERV